MEKKAELKLNGKVYEFPTFIGTKGEKAIDFSSLRKKTSYISYDPGFGSTGSCKSDITFINGEKGILSFRGISIEELAEHSSFLETAYLLIKGELPAEKELKRISSVCTENSLIHEDMLNFFGGFPPTAHPMLILSAMVASLNSYYCSLGQVELGSVEMDNVMFGVISKIRTISAFSYKKALGEPFVYPSGDRKYITNFLHMMFSSPIREYEPDPDIVRALEVLFIMHADHEQNCSTSTVRLVGSSLSNLFASIAAGINALWGRLHGGANQKVIEMLEMIKNDGGNTQKYIDMAKDKNNKFRLMGFGHRVYKNYDPRARIIKNLAHKILNRFSIDDPLMDIALELEEKALKDSYFKEKKLFPNVDFYSGLIYREIGFPTDMFPVLFAIARLPGWIAQWKEMRESSEFRIGRPRQIYTGRTSYHYKPLNKR
ncbi:MAG TPA: citrate synthase [Spirochaetota bacterium]|nr:citrate synthase [Spirochaetota bacterium]